jgi:recombination protein RecT
VEVRMTSNSASSAIARGFEIKEYLEENKSKIKEILPSYLRDKPGFEDKMVKAAMTAVNNPDLRIFECTPESVLLSVMKAAELGLDCSGTLGSGYLIAYGNTCTFSPGYRGLIDLATRGEDSRVADIWAYVVYENDEFDYALGDAPYITHKPKGLVGDRGKPIGVYMVALLTNGSKKCEVMNWSEVLEIRAMSKARNGVAWTRFIGQMARKAVIRRGMNYLPLSPETLSKLQLAFSDEDEFSGMDFDKSGQAKPRHGRKMTFRGVANGDEPKPSVDDIEIEPDKEAGF